MTVSIQYRECRLARLPLALGLALLLSGASSAPPPPAGASAAGPFSMNEGAHTGQTSRPHWNPSGFVLTGESCTVTIRRGSPGHKTVTVSFVAAPVEVPDKAVGDSPFFVGNFGENEALVVQTHEGRAVSVTHTSYDRRGDLNYGVSGSGDMFHECIIGY